MEGSVELSEIVRNWAIVAVGIGGAAVAIWRAMAADRQSKAQAQQARTGDLQRSSELFFTCLEALGSEKVEVRLSAVLVLEALAKEDMRMHSTVLLALQAFVRRLSEMGASMAADVDYVEAWRIVAASMARSGGADAGASE